jgi:phage gp36-like protein
LDPGDFNSFSDVSVVPEHCCEIDEFRLSSGAFGDNAMRVFRNVPNLIEGDAYFFVRR